MKNRNLIHSTINAINGLVLAIKRERSLKFDMVAVAVVLVLSYFAKLNTVEFLIICFTIALVISCELINTAIEGVVDLVVTGYDPRAKAIKDIAAAAELIAVLLGLVVAYFLLFVKLYRIIRGI